MTSSRSPTSASRGAKSRTLRSCGGASVETQPVHRTRPRTVRTKAKSRSRMRGHAYRSGLEEGRVSGRAVERSRDPSRNRIEALDAPLAEMVSFPEGKVFGQDRQIFEDGTLSPHHQA